MIKYIVKTRVKLMGKMTPQGADDVGRLLAIAVIIIAMGIAGAMVLAMMAKLVGV